MRYSCVAVGNLAIQMCQTPSGYAHVTVWAALDEPH